MSNRFDFFKLAMSCCFELNLCAISEIGLAQLFHSIYGEIILFPMERRIVLFCHWNLLLPVSDTPDFIYMI